jgi:hypothetical protein
VFTEAIVIERDKKTKKRSKLILLLRAVNIEAMSGNKHPQKSIAIEFKCFKHITRQMNL